MISSKFYSQLTVCPACRGWGTHDAPPKKYTDVCNECLGQGVSAVQSENIYIWDAPTFIDYGSRTRVLVLKIAAMLVMVLSVVLITVLVRSVLLSLF